MAKQTKPSRRAKGGRRAAASGRHSIPRKEEKILCMRSGGVCAFPGCGQSLIAAGSTVDDPVITGEIAHIVADSTAGPRGASPLSEADRDKHPNLILLCGTHHTLIDGQKLAYSTPVLRQMKADHEDRIRLGVRGRADQAPPVFRTDAVHSSLLPLTHLPQAVFAAACRFGERDERGVWGALALPDSRNELLPFILRGGELLAFHDLRQADGPFAGAIEPRTARPLRAEEMWADAEGMRRYVALLNRAMIRHGAKLGLRFDQDHRRFYFAAEAAGTEREVTYRPLNLSTATRKVVWQPATRADGAAKAFWWHLAAGLKFHHLGGREWCLSVRPERHVTTDGVAPFPPEKVGPKVTRLKARMFNEAYLSEVNFWKEFLTEAEPRLVMNFGRQFAVIEARLLGFDVHWPGVPGDEKGYANQSTPDDLFSLYGLSELEGGEELDWGDEGEAADDDE